MQKKLEELIKKFDESSTSFEAYQVISEFTEIVLEVPAYIEQIEKEADLILIARKRNNADKGWDLPRRAQKEHNERRSMIEKALHQLNPVFPLQNLHSVHVSLQTENLADSVDWLFVTFSPDDPMPESDKKEYKMFMEKVYKKIIPFLDKNIKKTPKDIVDLTFKKYDEKSRTLHIGKYVIPIAENEGNNNMHEVMAYIFIDHKDDLKQDFFYSELATERFGVQYDSKDKRAHDPYSGACRRINNKIKLETIGKIERFLDFNTSRMGSFKVDQKYLK